MLSANLWWKRVLISSLVACMVLSPGAAAKDEGGEKGENNPLANPSDQTTYGWVLVPTPEPARAFTPMSARGITHFYVPATVDAEFTLDTTDPGRIRSCTLGICFQSGDFDIVFFHERADGSTQVTGRHTAVGGEAGTVPPETTFGLVYLKTPATMTTTKGFEFAYTERLR